MPFLLCVCLGFYFALILPCEGGLMEVLSRTRSSRSCSWHRTTAIARLGFRKRLFRTVAPKWNAFLFSISITGITKGEKRERHFRVCERAADAQRARFWWENLECQRQVFSLACRLQRLFVRCLLRRERDFFVKYVWAFSSHGVSFCFSLNLCVCVGKTGWGKSSCVLLILN